MRSSIWQLGFRPFFLLGSLQALLTMLLWIGYLSGWITSLGHLNPVYWHAHEMIYGFTAAIVVGFVLTAAQNWTGIRGVHGKPLQALVLIWILARILIALSFVPAVLAAIVDLSFFPFAAVLMISYLKDPELKVERVFFLLFGLLFAGNLLVHLDALGLYPGHAHQGLLLGLDTIIVVIVFMGGRVIPFFTESSIARSQPKTHAWIEAGSHVSAAVFLICDVFASISVLTAVIAFATGVIHLARLAGWQVARVRRIPLIWVLHLAYLWLVIGFFLSGFAGLGILSKYLAIHAFTVGCLGIIIYGMITRVSLGHTGRRLYPSAIVVVGYYLLCVSALVRVFIPLILPGYYSQALVVSGCLWALAFLLFLVVYAPMLVSPRVDGKPG